MVGIMRERYSDMKKCQICGMPIRQEYEICLRCYRLENIKDTKTGKIYRQRRFVL